MAELKVTVGRSTRLIDVQPNESLLDAVLRQGIDAPYSCMEGVCTACMAKVMEGEVDFPEDTTLSERDFVAGKILTCQAKIKSTCFRVCIDYDAV